jgi:hypothetical protein
MITIQLMDPLFASFSLGGGILHMQYMRDISRISEGICIDCGVFFLVGYYWFLILPFRSSMYQEGILTGPNRLLG